MAKDKTDRKENEGSDKDYYLENGLVVFTQAYHLKRGYCCQCGCRHCPFTKLSESSSPKSK